jgi:transcription antitermination factor NusB
LDRRTKARELAMQALCQLDVQGKDLLDTLRPFFYENADDEMTRQLAEKWTLGSWDYVKACDDLIAHAAMRWKLSRLSHVDRAILRLSVYQLKYCPDIPCKVVLNEAIEIAKRYSTEQSPRFINGVLDAVLKMLKPAHAEPSADEKGIQTS